MDLVDGLAVDSLECPRVLRQEVSSRMLDVLVLNQDGRIHLLPCDWVEVAIALKVPQNFNSLVCKATFENDRFIHQLVGNATQQVVGHLKLAPLLSCFLSVKLARNLLEYMQTDVIMFFKLAHWSHQNRYYRLFIIFSFCGTGQTLLTVRRFDINPIDQGQSLLSLL